MVYLGDTVASATICASLEAPYPHRQSEGSIRFSVSLSPWDRLAAGTKLMSESIEASRVIERGLKESSAVDLEALCVLAGRRVWHLHVDVRVLSDCGNALGAAGLAALGILCCYRRPDTSIDPDAPGGVAIHSTNDREPLPLTLHHLPIPITLALFRSEIDQGVMDVVTVLDPAWKEEATSSGSFLATVTPQGEICAIQKSQGDGMSPIEVFDVLNVAKDVAGDIAAVLKKCLESHNRERIAARVRRQTEAEDSLRRSDSPKIKGSIHDIRQPTNTDISSPDDASKPINRFSMKRENDRLALKRLAGEERMQGLALPERIQEAVARAMEEDEPSDEECKSQRKVKGTRCARPFAGQTDGSVGNTSEADAMVSDEGPGDMHGDVVDIDNDRSGDEPRANEGHEELKQFEEMALQHEATGEYHSKTLSTKSGKRSRKRHKFGKAEGEDKLSMIGNLIAEAGKKKIDNNADSGASVLASSLKKKHG